MVLVIVCVYAILEQYLRKQRYSSSAAKRKSRIAMRLFAIWKNRAMLKAINCGNLLATFVKKAPSLYYHFRLGVLSRGVYRFLVWYLHGHALIFLRHLERLRPLHIAM